MEKKMSEKEWPLEAGDRKCDGTVFFFERESENTKFVKTWSGIFPCDSCWTSFAVQTIKSFASSLATDNSLHSRCSLFANAI